MASIAPSSAQRASLSSPFSAEPLFAATGLLLALSLLVSIPAMWFETRLLQDENVWIKPIKFQVALSLFLLTLAFFARYLPPGMTQRLSYRVYAAIVVFAIIGEMLWVGGAALFGVASHFNLSTPLMAALYPIMGVFALTLTSATLIYGISIWRHQQFDLHPALRLSIALGLCLTFVLTVPVAFTLSSGTGHLVGTPVTGATVAVFGWSREVGDLRIAHFFATHAMHFLPLVGWLLVSVLSVDRAKGLVWLASFVFSGFVAFTFFQALGGQPLLPLA